MDSKLIVSKQWFIDSHQGNIKDVYHFVERLGSGGFGVVYLAEDRKTSKWHIQEVWDVQFRRYILLKDIRRQLNLASDVRNCLKFEPIWLSMLLFV